VGGGWVMENLENSVQSEAQKAKACPAVRTRRLLLSTFMLML